MYFFVWNKIVLLYFYQEETNQSGHTLQLDYVHSRLIIFGTCFLASAVQVRRANEQTQICESSLMGGYLKPFTWAKDKQ